MIDYIATNRNPNELTLGCKLKHVSYDLATWDKRPTEHQDDWIRLFIHVRKYGIENPLIVFRDCVLIGQRRCEIARIQNIKSVACLEIQEDITDDAKPYRVEELTTLHLQVSY